MGLSENSVPLHPMVLLIIIPTFYGYNWGYTPFSDIPILKPMWKYFDWMPTKNILGLWKARMFFLRRCVEVELFWGKKRGSGVKKKPAIEKLKGHLRRTNYLEDLGRLNLKRAHVLLAKTGLQTATRTVWNRIQNHAELWEHRGCPCWAHLYRTTDCCLNMHPESAVLWFQSS